MKFRRKASAAQGDAELSTSAAAATPTPDPPGPASVGPHDDDVDRVDLGGLLIAPAAGQEVRIQVDEASGSVQAVMLAGPEGALELQAFSAPRNGDLWGEVHSDIEAEVIERGGSVTREEGRFGVELVCQIPVADPQGNTGIQVSRIVGVNGDRWMLRASFLGRPAQEGYAGTDWETALNNVRVRRGNGAMPVGRGLPIVLPDSATRMP